MATSTSIWGFSSLPESKPQIKFRIRIETVFPYLCIGFVRCSMADGKRLSTSGYEKRMEMHLCSSCMFSADPLLKYRRFEKSFASFVSLSFYALFRRCFVRADFRLNKCGVKLKMRLLFYVDWRCNFLYCKFELCLQNTGKC